MSSKVDNRVVKMTFDNAQFQKGIKNTMETLTEFENKLKMEGASAGFDKVKEAAHNLDLSALSQKAEGIKGKFQELKDSVLGRFSEIKSGADSTDFSGMTSNAKDAAVDVIDAMGSIDMASVGNEAAQAGEGFDVFKTIAIGALLEVGDEITNFVTNKLQGALNTINDFTLKPISEGFNEYETQMGSIQTIMANTGMDFHSQEDIDIVNDALEELNHYADMTIYNFTEMTRNIGTFTAAGVDLDTSVSAIQGLANVAALSGANANQASNAMYQLSQALAAGTVKLMDWRSIENSSMGGAVFQEQIMETARAHGLAIDEIVASYGSFRASLEENWLTADIMTETLYNMTLGTMEYEDAIKDLTERGYTEEQAESIYRLAVTAQESATKVRTWSQLWDTVKEAIGSNWTSIWSNLIGDFGQATDLFTRMSDTISNGVNSLLGGLVDAAKAYNQSGAYYLIMGGEQWDEATKKMERIYGAFDWIVMAISGPLEAIKDAFDTVFSFGDTTVDEETGWSEALENMGIMFVGIAQAVNSFTQSLVANDAVLTAIRQVAEAVFTVIKIGIQIIADAIGGLFKLAEIIRIFVDPILDIVATIIGIAAGALTDLMNAIMGLIDPLRVAIGYSGTIIDTIRDMVNALVGLIDIPGKLQALATFIHDIFWAVYDFFGIPKILNAVAITFSNLSKIVQATFGIIKGEITDEDIGDSADRAWARGIKSVVDSIKAALDALATAFNWILTPINNFFDLFANRNKDLKDSEKTTEDFATKVTTYAGLVASAAETVASILISVFAPVVALITAIVEKVPEMWNAFLNWGPVATVLSMFNDAGNNILNFFNGIVDNAGAASDGIHSAFDSIQNWNPFAYFNEVAEYWKTHTVDQIIADAQRIKDDFIDRIVGAFEYLKTKSPADIFTNFVYDVAGKLRSITKTNNIVSDILDSLDSIFPGVKQALEPLEGLFDDLLWKPFQAFREFVGPIAQSSKDIPSFFSNLFIGIKDAILNGIRGIPEWFSSLNMHVLAGDFLKGFRGIVDWFKTTFPSISEPIENVYKIVSDFVRDVTDRTHNIGDVFGHIWEKLKAFIEGIPIVGDIFKIVSRIFRQLVDKASPVIDIFVSLRDNVLNVISDISDKLSSLPGVFGEFFGFIKEKIDEFLGKANPKKVVEDISGALGTVSDKATEAKDGLGGIIEAIDPAGVPGRISSFVGVLKDDVKTKFDELVEYISDWPTRLNELISGIADSIPEDAIDKFFKIVERVIQNKLLLSTANLFDSLSGLAKSASVYMKGNGDNVIDKAIKSVRNIAISLAIVAAALWVVSTIPQDKLWQSVGVIGVLALILLALEGLSAVIQHFSGLDGSIGDSLAKTAASILILSFGLRHMIKTLELFWAMDPNKLAGGLIKAGFAIGVLLWVIKKFGTEDALKAGAGLLLVSLALNLMIPPIKAMAELFDGKNIGEMFQAGLGIAALMGFVAVLAASLDMIGKDGIKAGTGLLIASIALIIIGEAIKNLVGLDLGQLAAATGALFALVAAFGALVYFTKEGDLVSSAKAMLIYSAALAVMSFSLYQLARLKADSLINAASALGVLIVVLSILVNTTDAKDLVKTSGALVLFGVSILAMSIGLAKLATLDAGALIAAGGAIAVLMVALGALSYFTEAMDLVKTSAALLIFSIALAAMGIALSIVAKIDGGALLAATLALGGLIVVFGVLAGVLSSIPGSAIVLAALALAFISLGAACVLIATALSITVDALAKLATIGPVLAMFVQLVASNLGSFILAAVAFAALGASLVVLGAGLLIFGTGATLAGLGLTLLSNGIRDFLILLAQLPILTRAALDGLIQFIIEFPSMIGEALSTLWTWFTEEILPKIPEFIEQAIGAIGEFIGPFGEWVTGTAIPAIGEFILGIGAKLNEWAPMVLDWIKNTALPALGTFLSNFWHWVTTEGWPKALEFIKGFVGKIGEFAQMFWNWLQTDGLPAIGKGISDMIAKFQEIWPDIVEWGRSIPDKILEGLGNFANWAAGVGDDIARGIADGLSHGIDWIVNAVTSLGDQAMNAICDFFGINSPSKLMRDVVGLGIDEGVGVGIIKYASYAIDSAKRMASDTTNAINSGFGEVGTVSPSISPVLDMSSANVGMADYVDAIGRIDFVGAASFAENLDANLDSTFINDLFRQQINEIAQLRDQNRELLIEVEALRTDMATYNEIMSKTPVVLDSGALVGAIAPKMDQALGARAALAERGVY